MTEALALRGIDKSFGSVHALRGADFILSRGEVHALLGENGAGKSTLLHIAAGMLTPDGGTLSVHGQPMVLRTPRDARVAGIGMVHQHFTSIGALTVAENLALAAGRLGAEARRGLPPELWEGLVPSARVDDLTVGLRQRLEIIKALGSGARILLLDEPTAVLAPSEVEAMLALIKRFAVEGGAVALVTHKLAEALGAADRVTVLRDGAKQLSGPVSGYAATDLVEAMIGRGGVREPPAPQAPRPAPAEPRSPIASFGGVAIHAGELVGVAAIEGNGQRELLRGLVASQPGFASLIPEDRMSEGLIPELSLSENVVLGLGEDPRWRSGPWIRWAAVRGFTTELIERFGVRAPGPDAAAATLSGGNQQRIVIARALAGTPRLLVAENPTRGLDIRATADVHERLREAARSGVAVVVHSADLDEVLSLGDRILVVHRGRVAEAPPGADRAAVGRLMLGLSDAA